MTAYAQTGRNMSHGLNETNRVLIAIILAAQGTSSDTISVTMPDGVDKNLLPHKVSVFTTASPAVAKSWTITSHNRSTGVTVLTPVDTAAAGSYVMIEYVQAPLP